MIPSYTIQWKIQKEENKKATNQERERGREGEKEGKNIQRYSILAERLITNDNRTSSWRNRFTGRKHMAKIIDRVKRKPILPTKKKSKHFFKHDHFGKDQCEGGKKYNK